MALSTLQENMNQKLVAQDMALSTLQDSMNQKLVAQDQALATLQDNMKTIMEYVCKEDDF